MSPYAVTLLCSLTFTGALQPDLNSCKLAQIVFRGARGLDRAGSDSQAARGNSTADSPHSHTCCRSPPENNTPCMPRPRVHTNSARLPGISRTPTPARPTAHNFTPAAAPTRGQDKPCMFPLYGRRLHGWWPSCPR